MGFQNNISLNKWISELALKLGDNFDEDKYKKRLFDRGYQEEEMNKPIEEEMLASPRLFLNALYESLIEMDIPEKIAKEQLKTLAAHAKEIEEKVLEPAHFIWVGPPGNGSELIGVYSLSKTKPSQPIKLWVLNDHVEAYKDKVGGLKNVTVISIENYVKKMNLSFDRSNQVTLSGQIENYKNNANKTIKLASEEKDQLTAKIIRKRGIRDRVTIVDYVKSFIPLYEGGWVFDADITFLPSNENPLGKPNQWLFPGIGGGSDVWFYYRDKCLDWDTDKEGGKIFLDETSPLPSSQMYLYFYHLCVLQAETLGNDNDEEKQLFYSLGILLMSYDLNEIHEKAFGPSRFNLKPFDEYVSQIESHPSLRDDSPKNRVTKWLQNKNVQQVSQNQFRLVQADVSRGNMEDKSIIFPGLYKIDTKAQSTELENFRFIKKMNQSYIQQNNTAMQFAYLSLETKEMFSEVFSMMHKVGIDKELWTEYSGNIPFIGGGSVPIIGMTPLHLSVLVRSEFYPIILEKIPEDVFYALSFNKVKLPEVFFREVEIFNKFSPEELKQVITLVKANPKKTKKFLTPTIIDTVDSLNTYKGYRYDQYAAFSEFLAANGRPDLQKKLIKIEPYQPIAIFKNCPTALLRKLKKNLEEESRETFGDYMYDRLEAALKNDVNNLKCMEFFHWEYELLVSSFFWGDYSSIIQIIREEIEESSSHYQMSLFDLTAHYRPELCMMTLKKLDRTVINIINQQINSEEKFSSVEHLIEFINTKNEPSLFKKTYNGTEKLLREYNVDLNLLRDESLPILTKISHVIEKIGAASNSQRLLIVSRLQ